MNAEIDVPEKLEPATAKKVTGKGRQNPFINGRREWNMQAGRPIAEANWWRIVAFVCSLIALGSLAGLLKLGASTKVEPYVVLIDNLGRTVAQGYASDAVSGANDPAVRRALLSKFISNVRSVTSDGTAQKIRIKEAYAMMSSGDSAFQTLNDWFTSDEGDPFVRAKEETVSVQLSTILPLSENTYQAEWRETNRDRGGKVLSIVNYQGIIGVKQSSKISERQLMTNPIGLFIKEFTWTRQI